MIPLTSIAIALCAGLFILIVGIFEYREGYKIKKIKTENDTATLYHLGCGIYRPAIVTLTSDVSEMMWHDDTTYNELIDFARHTHTGKLTHIKIVDTVEVINISQHGKVIPSRSFEINESNIRDYMEYDRLRLKLFGK